MGTMTIRQVNDDLKARLKKRAEENGVSMEAEVRSILNDAVKPKNAWDAIQEALGPDWEGVDFEIDRVPDRPLPDFN